MQWVQYSEWIVPVPVLFAIVWLNFNSPPTNRSGTTRALFSIGLTIYCFLIAVLWLLVIIAVSEGSIGFDKVSLALGTANPHAQAEFAQYAPLLAALMMVAATQVSWIRKIDNRARKFCIELAAIPREADRLALELAQTADFRPKSERLRAKISEVVTETIGVEALKFEADGSAASQFTRAVGLYWLFVRPNTNGAANEVANRAAYTRVMQLGEATLVRLAARYDELMETGLAYFTATHPTRELRQALDRSISEVSLLTCSLIARYVLYSTATESKRRQRLSTMGFDATGAIWKFGADQWVTTILAVIVLGAGMMVFLPGTLSLEASRILAISVTFALSIGFAVIGGVWAARRFLERHDRELSADPPIAELTLAALIVAGLSIGLRIAFPLVPALIQGSSTALPDAINMFIQRWPGIIIPFACTISLGLLCAYVGARPWRQLRVAAAGALGNGLAFMLAALFVAWLVSDDALGTIYKPDAPARLLMIVNTGLIGAAIGAIVLWQFKRLELARLAEAAHAAERMSTGVPGLAALKPPECLDPAAPTKPGVAAQIYGGYSYESVSDLVGGYICFRPALTAAGVISAYLIDVHWDKETSCLTFDEKDREDAAHAQRGRVYIPDGRQFMSLVTVEGGSIRLVTVSRPAEGKTARGLIMTLSNPSGIQFTPASAPIVLRRLADQKPRLGFIRPDAPEFESYRAELAAVAPAFGFFAGAPQTAPSADARPTAAAEEARLSLVG
jgi:uncharacterized protein YneF (UPF0154 family)